MAGRSAHVMTPKDRELGRRVRQARIDYGMTQRTLAGRAHISAQTLNFLENGRIANPSVLTIIAIADVLGVSTDYLFGRQRETGSVQA